MAHLKAPKREPLTAERNKTVRFPTQMEERIQRRADAAERSFSAEVRMLVRLALGALEE